MRVSASIFVLLALFLSPLPLSAQSDPYAPGWDLVADPSSIRFGSIKFVDGEEVVETHSFSAFTSTIEPGGDATLTVKLDSVDTKNDLRNVRMRFLFFETFKYPEAQVKLRLTPDMAAGVAAGSRKSLTVPLNLTVSGVARDLVADISVEATSSNRIVVKSEQPLIFRIDDFGLTNNLIKIAETAGGFEIVPKMTISFALTYDRRGGGAGGAVVAAIQEPQQPVVNEVQGNFDIEACLGRFEILSETGNIYFSSGSARLEPDSAFVLAQVIDIIQRCPGLRILIAGHTDSDGSNGYNQVLSERRAQSVASYLTQQGVNPLRLFTAGFGEDRPMASNDTAFNKSRNRRIEFALYR